ncbi:MAG: hypothetical protein N3D84_00900 [Candidatus Woesearchaeota archaeon]|nr:hypothetical protein [Candidatus Woesearchaeota archaeon]
MKIFSFFSESFSVFKKSSYRLMLPILFDFLFVLLFGILLFAFGNLIINNLYGLGASLIQELSPSAYTKNIIIYIGLFFAILYLLYSIFQGLSWRYCCIFVHGKRPDSYIKRFFAVNLLFFFCFIAYALVSFMLDLYEKRSAYIAIPLYLFALAIFYFASLSYTAIFNERPIKALKRSFSAGAKRYQMMIIFAIILAAFLILDFITAKASMGKRLLVILLFVAVMLPAIAYAKITLVSAASKYLYREEKQRKKGKR